MFYSDYIFLSALLNKDLNTPTRWPSLNDASNPSKKNEFHEVYLNFIKQIKPHIYFKGPDYRKMENDNTKNIDQIRIYNNAYYDYLPNAVENDESSIIDMNAPQSFLSKFNLPKVNLRFGETFPSLSSENILVSFKIN